MKSLDILCRSLVFSFLSKLHFSNSKYVEQIILMKQEKLAKRRKNTPALYGEIDFT
jgi:hypothetical protein